MRMQGFVLVWREHVSPHWQRWNADKRKFFGSTTQFDFFFHFIKSRETKLFDLSGPTTYSQMVGILNYFELIAENRLFKSCLLKEKILKS